MAENERNTDALVEGVKGAAVHFSKAAIEVASGLGLLVAGVLTTVRNEPAKDTDTDTDRPQRIDVE